LIAFFDTRHRLSVVPATGGRVRNVGAVKGMAADWQPLPAKRPAPCRTPPGSTTAVSSDTAIVTVANGEAAFYPYARGSAYMGCYRADGRERLLSNSVSPGYATGAVTEAAVAGQYAALAGSGSNTHDQTASSGVDVFDLRTGLRVPARGGEGSMCEIQSSPPCATRVDELVLGGDAVSAAHTTVRDVSCAPVPQPGCRYTVEQIQASDGSGLHTLDSVTEPDGSSTSLTDLVLRGDTLTWDDRGTQHSARLQP
jgi:hypothetical protein